jgi:hypothetical protein
MSNCLKKIGTIQTGWIYLSEILAGGLLNTSKPCKYQLQQTNKKKNPIKVATL